MNILASKERASFSSRDSRPEDALILPKRAAECLPWRFLCHKKGCRVNKCSRKEIRRHIREKHADFMCDSCTSRWYTKQQLQAHQKECQKEKSLPPNITSSHHHNIHAHIPYLGSFKINKNEDWHNFLVHSLKLRKSTLRLGLESLAGCSPRHTLQLSVFNQE